MKQVRSRLEACLKELALDQERALECPGSEALHDFRVDLRTLRSALRVLEPVCGKRRSRALQGRLRRLFRSTQALRDQSVQARFRRASVPGPRSAATRAFREASRALPAEEIAFQVGALIGPELGAGGFGKATRAAARKRFRKDWNKARRMIDSPSAARGEPLCMHRIRIRIKRLRYNIEIFGAHLPRGVRENKALLKRAQTFLGDLHDRDIALASMNGKPAPPPLLAERSALYARSMAELRKLCASLGRL